MGLTRLGKAWEAPVNIQLAWFAAAIYIQEGGGGTSQGITRDTGGMKEEAHLPEGSWYLQRDRLQWALLSPESKGVC